VFAVKIDDQLVSYYSARAAGYEQIYDRPERQSDLAVLRRRLRKLVAGERVLELACGTGYWTEVMAATAASIRAIDASESSIEIARARNLASDSVSLEVGDVFEFELEPGAYSTVVTGFLWSHLPRQECRSFVRNLGRRLGQGIRAIFFDNRFVEGSSTPIARMDDHGDSYQLRTLDGGGQFEVVKNFPTKEELLGVVRAVAGSAEVEELEYFWLLRFEFDRSIS
jgi:demethylmenaquinone methyltransferase/2-methoxy-6-polyprenyl-1,4-benzoquinol methylase